MGNRDDFSPEIKTRLAQRAGFKCSFPGCGTPTIGPSDESPTSTSNTGMACHISSAAGGLGSRRYDPAMSTEDRKSINNGIWMCYTHGKLIDTDEARFTVPMLRKWREIAELNARIQLEKGTTRDISLDHLVDIDFADQELQVDKAISENELIGDALVYSCVPLIWGVEVAHAVRDVAVELTRNAFQHGYASSLTMRIFDKIIELVDDGNDFDQWQLFSGKMTSGGSTSIKHLIHSFGGKVVFSCERSREKNITRISLINTAEDIFDVTDCCVEIKWSDVKDRRIPYKVHESCKIIYLVLPRYYSISDSIRLKEDLVDYESDNRPMAFILQDSSPKARSIIASNFPDSRVICLSGEKLQSTMLRY